MSDRAYTVSEIDALRRVCEDRFNFGTTYWPPGVNSRMGRMSMAGEKDKAVEEMIRTYMIAGITAEDIIEADKPKVNQGAEHKL